MAEGTAREVVSKLKGVDRSSHDAWRFNCPVDSAHGRVVYWVEDDEFSCKGGCTREQLLDQASLGFGYVTEQGGAVTVAVPFAEMDGGPPECSKAHGPYSDRRQCLACTLRSRWVYQEVERRVRTRAGQYVLPEMINLADLLAEPDDESESLIEELWPTGGNVLFSAMYKAGKTTTRNNVARSLVDGDPFLGTFGVPRPVQGLAVLDLELPRNKLRSWFRDQGISRSAGIEVFPMKGQAHTLNVFDPTWQDLWAERLSGFDVVILDCFDPVVAGLNLDPNNQGRKLLEQWGAVLTQAGVAASMVMHHHGHGGERAKGDSGILGWPDAIWDLVLEEPNNLSSRRYFRAYGRDVEVDEGRLDFEPETRHLRYVGGASRVAGRNTAQASDGLETLLKALRTDHHRRIESGDDEPTRDGCSVRWGAKAALETIGKNAGLGRDQTRAAIEAAEIRGLLVKSQQGSSHSQVYALSKEGLARGERG